MKKFSFPIFLIFLFTSIFFIGVSVNGFEKQEKVVELKSQSQREKVKKRKKPVKENYEKKTGVGTNSGRIREIKPKPDSIIFDSLKNNKKGLQGLKES